MLSDRDTAVCNLLRGSIDRLKIAQASAVAMVPLSEALAEALLDLPSIVGLFHNTPAAQRKGEYAFDPANGPPPSGPAILPQDLVLLGRRRLGLRSALYFARSGARRVIAHNNSYEPPTLLSIYDLVAKEINSALRERVMQQLARGAIRNSAVRQLFETVEIFPLRDLGTWISDIRGRAEIPKSVERGPIVHAIGSLAMGGSERQLKVTVTNMQKKIDGVKILCINPKNESAAFFADGLSSNRVEVVWNVGGQFDHFFPSQSIVQRARQIESSPLPAEVTDTVLRFVFQFDRLKPRVVHSWLDYTNITAGLAAVLCGVPRIVLGCRSVAPYHFSLYRSYFRPIYRALLRSPGVVLTANSRAGANDYASWLGIRSSEIKVINNAVDLSTLPKPPAERLAAFRKELGLGSDPVVGTIGRLADEKRPLLWLHIACEVLKQWPRAKFLWVGSGPVEPLLRKEIAALNLCDRVFVVGARKDVSTVLSAFSVCLLTSSMEGLPNVLIEAQALGIPVVSAAVGGAPETFQEGITGLGVSGSRAADYAAAVTHFLENADAIAQAKQYGPMFIEERFSVDNVVDEMLTLYSSNS